MKFSRLSVLFVLLVLATTLTGCDAIVGIFKGGVYVGVIGVFLVLLLLWWLVRKMSSRG